MPAHKPELAVGYTPRDVALVRSACLSLATFLGDFLDDLVVVGGLVPTLLIPVEELEEGKPVHIGTQDLDLGIGLALLDQSRYVELVAQLRAAGFVPDATEQGKPSNYRWKHSVESVTVDFLIAPGGSTPVAGNTKVRIIDEHLSAFLAVGLPLAFEDRRKVSLAGKTLRGEDATRELWVAGAGAFIVLKALACKGLGLNKDAYDLVYVLENYGTEHVTEVAAALRPLLNHPATEEAIAVLRSEFGTATSVGPMRAAAFLGADENFRADVVGAVAELLRLLGR